MAIVGTSKAADNAERALGAMPRTGAARKVGWGLGWGEGLPSRPYFTREQRKTSFAPDGRVLTVTSSVLPDAQSVAQHLFHDSGTSTMTNAEKNRSLLNDLRAMYRAVSADA